MDAARRQSQAICHRGRDRLWTEALSARSLARANQRETGEHRIRRIDADTARTDRVPETARAKGLRIPRKRRVDRERWIRLRQMPTRAAGSSAHDKVYPLRPRLLSLPRRLCSASANARRDLRSPGANLLREAADLDDAAGVSADDGRENQRSDSECYEEAKSYRSAVSLQTTKRLAPPTRCSSTFARSSSFTARRLGAPAS